MNNFKNIAIFATALLYPPEEATGQSLDTTAIQNSITNVITVGAESQSTLPNGVISGSNWGYFSKVTNERKGVEMNIGSYYSDQPGGGGLFNAGVSKSFGGKNSSDSENPKKKYVNNLSISYIQPVNRKQNPSIVTDVSLKNKNFDLFGQHLQSFNGSSLSSFGLFLSEKIPLGNEILNTSVKVLLVLKDGFRGGYFTVNQIEASKSFKNNWEASLKGQIQASFEEGIQPAFNVSLSKQIPFHNNKRKKPFYSSNPGKGGRRKQ